MAEGEEEEDEDGEGGDVEDRGVEGVNGPGAVEVVFFGAEEDVNVAFAIGVLLFHFGGGDQVGDFLIYV